MYFLDQSQAAEAIVRLVKRRVPLIETFRGDVERFVGLAYQQGLRLAKQEHAPGCPKVPTDGSWWLYNARDAMTVLGQKAQAVGLPSFIVGIVLQEAVPAFYGVGYALMAPNPARRSSI